MQNKQRKVTAQTHFEPHTHQTMTPYRGAGGALMNFIMDLADLGKSENNEFMEHEKSENNEFGTSLENLKIMNVLVQKWQIFLLLET